jgi:hypothetical protein
MKTVKIVLTTIAMLSAIGCSNNLVGPNSTDQSPTTSVATFKIDLQPLGELGKTQAATPTQPTVLLISWDGSTNWDSVAISAGATSMSVSHAFTRTQTYTVIFYAIYPGTPMYQFNGGRTTFTVPDSATFAVSATLAANLEILNFPLILTGTPVANTADTITISWTNIPVGSEQVVTQQATQAFTAGSLTSITLTGLMAAGLNYKVAVHIGCNDATQYNGSANLVVNASTDYSLSIPLTKSGGTTSTGSFTVALSKRGTCTVGVTWN